MTRKDYVLIAGALARTREGYAANWDPNLFRACNDTARSVADALQADNPRFNRTKFMEAAKAHDRDML